MFKKVMSRLFPPREHKRGQRGYVVLTLALVGLMGGAVVAVPILQRATSGLRAHSGPGTSVGSSVGAESAVEHALWRIRHDVPFVDSFAGAPPGASYAEDILGDGVFANVAVTASSAAPPNEGMQVRLTSSTAAMTPGTPAVITYTLKVTNYDNEPHDLSRITVQPLLWFPSFVTGSASGITSNNPDSCFILFGCIWNLWPYYTVPAHGGEATMTFQMLSGPMPVGTWWTYGAVRVEGVGTIVAPQTARSTFMVMNGLDIDVLVRRTNCVPVCAPGDLLAPDETIAGEPTEFRYDITVTNGDTNDIHMQWVRHWTQTMFDYVAGSASGTSSAQPAIVYDWISNRDRHTWTLSPTLELEQAEQTTQSLEMETTLLPGVFASRSSFKVTEDPGWLGTLSSMTSGEAATVTAYRKYTIVATYDGVTITAEAVLTPTRDIILSWEES
jgi:hypothetical protein